MKQRGARKMSPVPETHGRALWIEEFVEEYLYQQQDFQNATMTNAFMERLGCLNCNSGTHETNDCILPSRFFFNHGCGDFVRRMVLLKARCNMFSNPRYMLPYDYPLKGTVLHVDRKENCLYIRPQILDDVCNVLENTLFHMRHIALWPAPPSKINIGDVYLVRRQGSNVLARAVCGHMFFSWQMATQWQMYLIDIGQTEFVDQRSIYLLPSELHAMPPMAVPVVLTNCRVRREVTAACSLNHFAVLNIGSTCIFALSSYYEGQPLSLSKGGYYPSFVNSLYPPPLLARVFRGSSLHDEIFCTWGLPENTSPDHAVCLLYCPSTFSFSAFTLESSPPVTLTVRVTDKISQNQYWLRDSSLCSFISKQIALPSNGLWPYIDANRSLACIARLQRQIQKRSRYYRAIASNFDNQRGRCMVFLIDYGQTVHCDIHDLFDLSDQPATVLCTRAAAFKCTVSKMSPNNEGAKLGTDGNYVIQVIGKEDEQSYIATVDTYIQADFQYPQMVPNGTESALATTVPDGCSGQRPAAVDDSPEDINQSSDNSEADIAMQVGNGSSPEQGAVLAAIRAQMSLNQVLRNALKALDLKISLKLDQMSSRMDGLFSALNLIQSVNNIPGQCTPPHLHHLYGDLQAGGAAQQDTRSSRTSPPPAYDAKDLNFCGNPYHQHSLQHSSLLGQPPLSRYQTAAMCSQQYLPQQQQQQLQHQPNITFTSGRCFLQGYENHNCAYATAHATGGANNNYSSQLHPQIYTNNVNQKFVQHYPADHTHQQMQLQPQPQRATASTALISGCAMCSLHRGMEQQQTSSGAAAGSCCFCGAYMEARRARRVATGAVAAPMSALHHIPAKHSTAVSRLHATTRLQHVVQRATADEGLNRASTVSINSTSTVDSSCKNSNTPSNAGSQLSSRSSSPVAVGYPMYRNQDSLQQDGKSLKCETYASKVAVAVKEKAADEKDRADSTTRRISKRTHQVEMSTKLDKVVESPRKTDVRCQSAALSQWFRSSEKITAASSEKHGECVSTVNHTSNLRPNTSHEKKGNSACMYASSQTTGSGGGCGTSGACGSSQQRPVAVSPSNEAQYKRMPETCWICGKVGHLTRYCQSTPPTVWLLAQQMKEAQAKASPKPRDEKGRVLYTSDESSDDEQNYDSDSDGGTKKGKNSLDREIKLMSDAEDDGEPTVVLKYKAYFGHLTLKFGAKYAVTRSDDDTASSLWPLFFVQIQNTECNEMLDKHLDSLKANIPLSATEMVVGVLCIAYCVQFDAKFRAVITAICSDLIEVFFVDYGNYEWVDRSSLWSIADQDRTALIQPGMAIPCILSAYDQEKSSGSRSLPLNDTDVSAMKSAVSCGRQVFWLRFRQQRPDGICVADVLDNEEAKAEE